MSAKDLPQINFRIEEEPLRKLRLIATREGTSLSELLREAVDHVIKEHSGKKEWLEEGIKG